MMATSMEADSEVLFKEKREGKGVKAETAVDVDFRASTSATSPPGRGAEHRGGDGEEQRRIELKKFSLRPEKYDGKGDFEGWVNQFEEYATLGQWNEEEKASLLFLSLTAGARMYFVGLPERLCESGESGTPRFPNGSRRGSTIEVCRAELSDLGDGGGDHRDPGRYTKKAVRALKQEESELALYLKAMGEKLEALMGEIKDDREQRKQWAARRESGRRQKADMECHSCHQKGHSVRECPTNATEGRSGNGQSPPSQ